MAASIRSHSKGYSTLTPRMPWAWHSRLLGKSCWDREARSAFSTDADRTREALAMHIIDLANRGERDANRLRDDAAAFVTDALQHNQA